MKRSFTVIFAVLFVAVLCITAAPSLVAQGRDYGRDIVTGVVTSIDSRRSEITVRQGRSDTIRVRADEAYIRNSGRSASFRDIHEGDTVRISGDVRSNGYMDAYSIDLVDWDHNDGYNRRGDERWKPGTIVTVGGTVRDADTRRGYFEFDSDRGDLRIITTNGTDIREMGRRKTVKDIRKGHYLIINGHLESYTTLRANTINIGGPDSRPGSGRSSILIGEVTRNTTLWDRNIKVKSPLGERTVKVPQNVDITRDGRGVSIHDINKGEIVRVLGRWSGDTMIANQVDVIGDRDYQDDYFGKIEKIDYNDREFRIKVRDRNYYIIARDADIFDNDRRISFRDLKNGQSVWITGDLRGDTIYADRIQRGGRYYKNKPGEYKPVASNR